MVFSFGTATGADTEGCVQGDCGTRTTSVPMPASLLLIGLGTVAATVVFVRSRRREARRDVSPAA